MKKSKAITLFLFLFALSKINAQQSTNATGNNASGSGGSVSYSVGQISYSSLNSANGVINEGVQQPYEFLTLGTGAIKGISLSYSVYPNPTNSTINLKVENRNLDKLSYHLYDNNGRLLLNKKITSIENVIPMGDFESAVYFIKIIENSEELQTIKIIKN